MRQLAVVISLACLTCYVTGAMAGDKKSVKRRTFKLPKNPAAVVVSLDFRGGYGPPRKKTAPTVSIRADGKVLVPDNYGLSQEMTGQLSPDELQELLDFIIEKNQFLKYDSAKVRAQIQEAQKPRRDPKGGAVIAFAAPRIADAPTTVVRVDVEGKQNEAQHYALSFDAGRLPQIGQLQQLYAIQKRLQRVMTLVHAGGKEKVAEMLALANRELKRQHPKAEPFAAKDLISAGPRRDGSRYYNFNRSKPGKDGTAKTATYVNAIIQIPAGEKPKVTIRAKLK